MFVWLTTSCCLQRNLSTLFPTDLSSILFVLFLPNFCFQRNCINDVILDKICILQGIQYCDFAFCCNSCVTFKNSILRGYWTWLQLYQAKWIYRGEGSSSKSDDVIYGWPLILLILFWRSESFQTSSHCFQWKKKLLKAPQSKYDELNSWSLLVDKISREETPSLKIR